jgi:hypothetical protein
MTKSLGTPSPINARQTALKPVSDIRISTADTVRKKRTRIEKKDIHPPEIDIVPMWDIISLSIKGLNIPISMAKGDTSKTFLMKYPAGSPPAEISTIG